MINTETYHIRTIHQETDKGIKVCKFGRTFWIAKRFVDIKKVKKGYEITGPAWIWNNQQNVNNNAKCSLTN